MKLNYVIQFVADMDHAVKFYRDVLGLPLRFQSPGWTEFSTGETSLALHPAFQRNPARSLELGFNACPRHQVFGGTLAQFLDSEGGRCSVAEQTSNSASHQ